MTSRDFILEITCAPQLEDEVQSRLFLTRSTGNTTTGATIAAYFDTPEDREEGAALLADLDLALDRVERDRVDWLTMYQQSLRPIEIGRRFIVAPDASLVAGSSRLPIVVPQEQAFGTGSHETTALCMEMLEGAVTRGASGLDIGSGSGILAIAMLLLGARKVMAFDNDTDAYGALRDNRIRNGMAEDAMPLFIGSVEALRGGSFDVVTMNIIPEVILPLLPAVRAHVGNTLILSGILIERSAEVVEAARKQGLTLEREKTSGEWWCGSFSARR